MLKVQYDSGLDRADDMMNTQIVSLRNIWTAEHFLMCCYYFEMLLMWNDILKSVGPSTLSDSSSICL